MTSFEDLLHRLDTANQQSWEKEYARNQFTLTSDELLSVATAEYSYSRWFALRADVGPPGVPLPPFEQALSAVLQAKGTALDAYQVVFTTPPNPPEWKADVVLGILHHSLCCALNSQSTWFSTWLAARFGLAALAMGQPRLAWSILDAFSQTVDGEKSPHLATLALFEPLRDNEALECNTWVRSAIRWFWPKLNVPAIPQLPTLTGVDTTTKSLAPLLNQLSQQNANEVRALVERYVHETRRETVKSHDGHPLVCALRTCVMKPGSPLPEVDNIPPWFTDWALAVASTGELRLARLAGLLLHRAGDLRDDTTANLVFADLRSADLVTVFQDPKCSHLKPILEELTEATRGLPEVLADALIAAAIPVHLDYQKSLIYLHQHIDELTHLELKPSSVIAECLAVCSTIPRIPENARVKAQTRVSRLLKKVAHESARIGDVRGISAQDAERIGSGIPMPDLDDAFLNVILAQPPRTPADKLILAIILRRALTEDHPYAHLRPEFTYWASSAIFELRATNLFKLRLSLLDELISTDSFKDEKATFHHQRANTRQACFFNDPHYTNLTLIDLSSSMQLARAAGDTSLYVTATALWAKVWAAKQSVHTPLRPNEHRQIVQAVNDTLELPMKDEQRVELLRGRAALLKSTSPEETLSDLETAHTLLSEDDHCWVEVAAEIVFSLSHLDRPAEALKRGEALLERASCTVERISLGTLHVAIGEAHFAVQQHAQAQRHLEAALDLIRGESPYNEHIIRNHLANIGLATDNRELIEEHHRYLRDHYRELSIESRRDLHYCEAEVAKRWNQPKEQRAAWNQLLPIVHDRRERIRVRLELALLDLAETRKPEQLDDLVSQALDYCTDTTYRALMLQVALHRHASLSPEFYDSIVQWATTAKLPSVAATVHLHTGQQDEAREVLRAALASELSTHERLACIPLYINLLGEDAASKQRKLCDELERLLGDSDGSPHTRLFLAGVVQESAAGKPDQIVRARRHAQRALENVGDDISIAAGNRILAALIVDELRNVLPKSSPAVAKHASWLLVERPIPTDTLAQLRLAAIALLLAPGVLIHPQVLSVAQQLAAMVPSEAQGVEQIECRLAWIQRCVDTQTLVAPPLNLVKNPYDHNPTWLVELVLGASPDIHPANATEGFTAIQRALASRPDAADRILSALLPLQHRLRESARAELLRVTYAFVQSTVAYDASTWAGLRCAIDKVPNQHRHPLLSSISSAIHRTSRSEPRPIEPPQSSNTPAPITTAERAHSCFEHGLRYTQLALENLGQPESLAHIRKARRYLGEAVRLAREYELPELFDCLVSSGNSWKAPPEEDIDKALAIYASTDTIDAAPEQHAKLWKVQADALRARGGEQDLRHAAQLLAKSLEIRQGWRRVETLYSAAQVALVHPDLDPRARKRRAVQYLIDAVRTDPKYAERIVPFLLKQLTEWGALQPDAPEMKNIQAELAQHYPSENSPFAAVRESLSSREQSLVQKMATHPAMLAYTHVAMRLMSPAERFAPTNRAEIEQYFEQQSLLGRLDDVEELVDTLGAAQPNAQRPGILAARAKAITYLVRQGRRPVEELREATAAARAALPEVEDRQIRAALLRELAQNWSPSDHTDGPTRDFALSVELLRECVALEDGEDKALNDTLAALARALRYMPSITPTQNLRESRQLYKKVLARTKPEENSDVRAMAIHNLAEVESQLSVGSRLERLKNDERVTRKAISASRSPHQRAQYQANLAWVLTQLGRELRNEEGLRYLKQAKAKFDQVDRSLLADPEDNSFTNNRTVCESTLAHCEKGRNAALAVWRRRLAELDGQSAHYSAATAKHNLANILLFGQGVTPEQFQEGIRLCREAIQVRTLATDARHYWETVIGVGRAYLVALHTEHGGQLVQMTRQATIDEAEAWLQRAAEAAQVLGPGEELAETGFALSEIALQANSTQDIIEHAEIAWTKIQAAATYLLLHRESREKEATQAQKTGWMLACRLARDSPIAPPYSQFAFVLQGDDAKLVRRWLIRSQEPARRPLRARLSKPSSVSAALWERWRAALAQGEQRHLADTLDEIRQVAPDFLDEDVGNEPMWHWLRTRPGSIATTMVLNESLSIVLLMQLDDREQPRTWVFGIKIPPPPCHPNEFAEHLHKQQSTHEGAMILEALAAWISNHAIIPVLRFLGTRPSNVLWCPPPYLRPVAPAALWQGIPVATTASLSLPDLIHTPGRPRSSLVVLADPGPTANEPYRDLSGHGVAALERLAKIAADRGPVRTLASVGARFGRTLLGEDPSIRDTPASARDVSVEAAEHDVIVFIAHGLIESPEHAALYCLDASGQRDPLDVTMLAQTPDRFTGATVLLLACESAKVGDSLAEPGGVAGVLISAGARCVVAPLWPVQLDVATQVAEAVLRGLTKGDEPWDVIARLTLAVHDDSPLLGKPPPSRTEQQAHHTIQQLSFITWVG